MFFLLYKLNPKPNQIDSSAIMRGDLKSQRGPNTREMESYQVEKISNTRSMMNDSDNMLIGNTSGQRCHTG